MLVVVGAASVFGYLFVHYDNTSLSASYTAEERSAKNKFAQQVVQDETDEWDDMTTLTVVESAYKKFLGDEITYTVAVYEVAEGTPVTDAMWGYSKSPAKKDENLTALATVTFVYNEVNGEVGPFDTVPAK